MILLDQIQLCDIETTEWDEASVQILQSYEFEKLKASS